MRCLVTGASGHLGAALTRHLLEHGASVLALVRQQSDLWRIADIQERIELIRADLADLGSVAEAIKEFAPDVVFHLAWYGVTSAYRNDQEQITRNVVGGLELFRIVQAAGCSCWIGVGSQAEYGPYDCILHEDLPPRPVTSYGVAKLSLSMLTQKLCELAGIRYVWLRLLATYGPQDDEKHLIPGVIRQLLNRQKPLLTPGEQKWDYLYISDAVEALYQTARLPHVSGVFNLGAGEAWTVRSIAERIRDLIDSALPLGLGDLPYRPDQVMHLQADIGRLKAATGWTPQVSMDEGLRLTVDWYRMHPARL